MGLAEAVTAIQARLAALEAIREAPSSPPEAAHQFPFAVTYPRTGQETPQSAGWSVGLHTLVCEVHIARLILAQDVARAIPLYEEVRSALLADPTLGGAVETITGLSYRFGRMEYAGQETIGYSIEIQVKLHSTY